MATVAQIAALDVLPRALMEIVAEYAPTWREIFMALLLSLEITLTSGKYVANIVVPIRTRKFAVETQRPLTISITYCGSYISKCERALMSAKLSINGPIHGWMTAGFNYIWNKIETRGLTKCAYFSYGEHPIISIEEEILAVALAKWRADELTRRGARRTSRASLPQRRVAP
jgi:hypothetical protein